MRLRATHVVVTGASRGIGALLTQHLAAKGARLTLVARTAPVIKEMAETVGGTAVAADLADLEEVRGLIDRIEAQAGPVDVLVNNAGIDNTGPFLAQSAEDVAALLQVNLVTPVELCRQVIPGMLERGRGHIVNVSSMSGTNSVPGLVTYSTSKAGLSHFTALLRAEFKGTPLRTTLVQLGLVSTGMVTHLYDYEPTDRALQRFARLRVNAEVDPETMARAVVRAMARDRRHVRMPARALLYPLLTEAPRRLTELFLTGVSARPPGGYNGADTHP